LGARPQRLLFASTGTKDPEASDVLYVDALAAPNTVNTMPQITLKATADHAAATTVLRRDADKSDDIIARFGEAKIDIVALAETLQRDGADSFAKAWRDLLLAIEAKSKVLG